MHHLQRDLEEWETMYLAGRLQKPVKILRQDAKLGLATKKNLENAIRVSLLMLPERFTEEELYLKIAGLSYSGDFRMRIGENPYKVFNIVYAQMDAFREKYDSIIDDLPNINKLGDGSLEVTLILIEARFISSSAWKYDFLNAKIVCREIEKQLSLELVKRGRNDCE